MKRYLADNGTNVKYEFTKRSDAESFCQTHSGYSVIDNQFWTYYDPHKDSREGRLIGNSLTEAIENGFVDIVRAVKFDGASGYTLEKVTLKKHDNSATLDIYGWPFSNALVGFTKSMLSQESMQHKTIEINGLEDHDMMEDEYVFDIK